MHYFIDGYNLMFRLVGDDKGFKGDREGIIEELFEKCQGLHLKATLFFDAQYNLEECQRFQKDNFEIRYTNYQETADDAIIEALGRKSHPKSIVVVTSDKKLAWRARGCGADTLPVEEFMSTLNKRWNNHGKIKPKKQEKKQIAIPPTEFQKLLETFEKELGEIDMPVKKKPLSEAERWRQIFEERLERDLDENDPIE